MTFSGRWRCSRCALWRCTGQGWPEGSRKPIDQRTRQIDELNQRIDRAMAPFRSFCDLICSIPGARQHTAEVIVAETGGDMTVFPSPKHLASWAGSARAATSPPAASNPPRPGPGTPT